VLRNREEIEVSSTAILFGDIVILTTGELSPADCIVFEKSDDFKFELSHYDTDMSSLTDTPGLYLNLNSRIISGKCRGLVVSVDEDTQKRMFAPLKKTKKELKYLQDAL